MAPSESAARIHHSIRQAAWLAPAFVLWIWLPSTALGEVQVADGESRTFCDSDKRMIDELLNLRDKSVPKDQVLAVIEELEPTRRTYREMFFVSVTEIIYSDDRGKREILDDFTSLCMNAGIRSFGDDRLSSLSPPEVAICMRATRSLDFLYALKDYGVPKEDMEAAMKKRFEERPELKSPRFFSELLSFAYEHEYSNETAVKAMPELCRRAFGGR